MAESGAAAWGCADAVPVQPDADAQYAAWVEEGCAASMDYLRRHITLRSDPRLLLEGARTVISAAFPYPASAAGHDGALKIARYALGTDYHETVRRRLDGVCAALAADAGLDRMSAFRVCVDSAPLAERYWARRAGVGFTGLNGQLFVGSMGSAFFLGEILTTLEFEPDAPDLRSCTECGACLRACPGGALRGDGTLDARRCHSYLTIEHRGDFPTEPRLGNRLYGCDICQDVCPLNRQASPPAPLAEFEPREALLGLTARDVAEMTQEEFSRIFSHSAVKRTKLAGLRRNASAIENHQHQTQSVMIQKLKNKLLAGGELSADEALALADSITDSNREELWDAAAEITARLTIPATGRRFDTCSIVNARSGRCPEDCKWCAQSAHYATEAEVYPLISYEKCAQAAALSRDSSIGRFSMVTSGRRMSGRDLETACGYFRDMEPLKVRGFCASMGLLDHDGLKHLREAGVSRYHCNLEAAPDHFATLCSTHTVDDKIRTLMAAREAGLEVCSGGIIGMGESRRQRVGLALELRKVDPCSIPINILCPIPGTPLADTPPIAEEEVLTTVALFRMIHPLVTLRFAGGRARLSRENQLRAFRIGINGAIVGDLLTTIGSQVADDRKMAEEAGYEF